jgi:hypothetical protein
MTCFGKRSLALWYTCTDNSKEPAASMYRADTPLPSRTKHDRNNKPLSNARVGGWGGDHSEVNKRLMSKILMKGISLCAFWCWRTSTLNTYIVEHLHNYIELRQFTLPPSVSSCPSFSACFQNFQLSETFLRIFIFFYRLQFKTLSTEPRRKMY